MNRDQFNDYEWYGQLMNHRNTSATGKVMNNTGINRHHKRYKPCCVDLMTTIIIAVVFTVFMYVWLA